MRMADFIFTANPKSFKISTQSALASKLKSSISSKLPDFLGNYADDVLSDYVTVLVCNGKHQYQARDDLEAFLKERSGEFVSWLWDLLLKYSRQSNEEIGLSGPEVVNLSGPHNGDTNSDSKINKLNDFQKCDTGYAHGSLSKAEKIYHLSGSGGNPVRCSDMILSEGFQSSSGFAIHSREVYTKKVRSEICGNEIPERVANENNIDDKLAYEISGKGRSSAVSTGGERSIKYRGETKKIENSNCSGLPNEDSYLSKREPVFRRQSSLSEYPHLRQISASYVSRSLSPRSVGATSHQNDKSRGSVWDRLGKPCDKVSLPGRIVDAHVGGLLKQDGEVPNQRTLMLPVPNGEFRRIEIGKVQGPGKRFGYNEHPAEDMKLEHTLRTTCKPDIANNIGRKRHFGEVCARTGTGSVSLVGKRDVDRQFKVTTPNLKNTNSTTGDARTTTLPLVSKVIDVKQRLLQIETEMSKLRSKQAKMEKDGKPNLSSHSGAVKHPEEDVKLRTVFVTNVHFAASREALSLYFGKCGAVVNVVILTDKTASQSKGSAYITFASEESVDKAVALSGTSFFSRTIKVLRKAELVPFAGKPSQAPLSTANRRAIPSRPYYCSSHLQWRRESVSAPSEQSVPTSIEEKRAASSASQQQLPSSPATVRTREANSCSMERPL